MKWQLAQLADVPLLADMNLQLIEDEGHRNPMGHEQLRERMQRWLESEYRAALFSQDNATFGYALYRTDEQGRIHLRHFFVARTVRRRGLGRKAFRLFRTEVIPPQSRVVLEVLSKNTAARAFWAAMGFGEHALTLELPPREGE